MSYTVMARRYRSQTFDDVVGQQPIAQALRNAIEQNRVAHAYLFNGTRGVGKTSMARILAKALAGGSPDADKAIMEGRDTDVIEIDAASNRGVEEARDLIANSIYRPLRGKFKVYIVDEAHMLTKEASNTLLKTLEEPPEHVKFILCTTEAHKLLPTIVSRCQRFDFRNIAIAEITEHLRAVCKTEGYPADADLLHAVARLANGSMRDGLSLLDRVIAAAPAGETLTLGLLERLLGLPTRKLIGELVEAFAASDPAAALARADALTSQGIGLEQLLAALIDRFHDLMLICACGAETPLLETTPEGRRELVEQAKAFDSASLVHMIALCESLQRASRSTLSPRAILDALMVRLAMTEKIADLAALMKSGAVGLPLPGRSPEPPAKKR